MQGVWGVGPAAAQKLYDKGFKTVDDLREAERKGESPLSNLQKIGLQYYDDLREKMPR